MGIEHGSGEQGSEQNITPHPLPPSSGSHTSQEISLNSIQSTPVEPNGLSPEQKGELDETVNTLQERAETWIEISINKKRELISECRKNNEDLKNHLSATDTEIKGLPSNAAIGESWFNGSHTIARYLRQLDMTLGQIEPAVRKGSSILEAIKAKTFFTNKMQVAVLTTPRPGDMHDHIISGGILSHVRFQEGVTRKDLEDGAAKFYTNSTKTPKVSLVLSPSNNKVIAPLDMLEELFVHGTTCCVKLHPQDEPLIPIFKKIFAPLVREGFISFAPTDSETGAYLSEHQSIDRIKYTGSAKVGEAIRDNIEKLGQKKEISTEQGNIGPLVIFPGNYSYEEMERIVDLSVSTVTHNGGYNCIATRLICLPDKTLWPQVKEFKKLFIAALKKVGNREAFVAGSKEALEKAHEKYEGKLDEFSLYESENSLPWTVLDNLDSTDNNEPFFNEETFAPLVGFTTIHAKDFQEFGKATTDFCNNTLKGSLSATLFFNRDLIGGTTAKERAVIDTVVDELRYGTVGLNTWGVGFADGKTPFGGHPSDTFSGQGFAHDSMMLGCDKVEKSVVEYVGAGVTPLSPMSPHFVVTAPGYKPAWSASNDQVDKLGSPATTIESHRLHDWQLIRTLAPTTGRAMIGSIGTLTSKKAEAINRMPKTRDVFDPELVARRAKKIGDALALHGVECCGDFNVAITGGGGSLGTALARLLGSLGCNVLLLDLKTEDAQKAKRDVNELGGTGYSMRFNVTKPKNYKRLQRFIDSEWDGKLDMFIPAAGLYQIGEVASMSPRKRERLANVNFMSPIHSLELLNTLTRQYNNRKVAGFYVNVGSIGGKTNLREMIIYAAAKAGVNALSEGLADELKGYNVWTSNAEPFYFTSELVNNGTITNPAEAKRQNSFVEMSSMSFESVAERILFGSLTGQRVIRPGWESKTINFFTDNTPLTREMCLWILRNIAEPVTQFRADIGMNPRWDEAVANAYFDLVSAPFWLNRLQSKMASTQELKPLPPKILEEVIGSAESTMRENLALDSIRASHLEKT